MSVSSLRVAKSETREFAERDRIGTVGPSGDRMEWRMSNGAFFTAFVVIAAAVAACALLLR